MTQAEQSQSPKTNKSAAFQNTGFSQTTNLKFQIGRNDDSIQNLNSQKSLNFEEKNHEIHSKQLLNANSSKVLRRKISSVKAFEEQANIPCKLT